MSVPSFWLCNQPEISRYWCLGPARQACHYILTFLSTPPPMSPAFWKPVGVKLRCVTCHSAGVYAGVCAWACWLRVCERDGYAMEDVAGWSPVGFW